MRKSYRGFVWGWAGLALSAVLAASTAASGAPASILGPPPQLKPEVTRFVSVPAGDIVIRHVTLIDGLGGPAQADVSLRLQGGRIVETGRQVAIPAGARVLDLPGRSVIPGIVGMHNHLFYIGRPNQGPDKRTDPPLVTPQMLFSAPKLYLAAGVTTMRTAGSVEPYADLNLKRMIDAGDLAGPHLDVTSPYLEGPGGAFIQMPVLTSPAEARRIVDYWADQGVTSFKAYADLGLPELKAAIAEAHRRGLKVTGHLCAVTYREAVEAGIDNIEHGFIHNTEHDPLKAPGVCTSGAGKPTLVAMDPDGPEAAALIRLLVERKVALTSTLAVSEQNWPGHAPLNPKAMAALTPEAREAYFYQRNRINTQPAVAATEDVVAGRHEMAMQRRFVAAGGLLMSGPDPTGNGGVIPGFGDQRGIELLVEAGFSPEAAIRIATYNGAVYLGLADQIGSVAAGRRADLVVVRGDPSRRISDIEDVEYVFKDGVGYDPARLLEAVRGRYGQY